MILCLPVVRIKQTTRPLSKIIFDASIRIPLLSEYFSRKARAVAELLCELQGSFIDEGRNARINLRRARQMSITERTQQELNTWAEHLSKANKFLATSRTEEIFDFLNCRENLCTPGFILRRQLLKEFPETIMKAAGVKNITDLNVSENTPWSTELVANLSALLVNLYFKNFGQGSLCIEKRQWQNFLSDEARCQRKIAVKLIFALKMDDATAAKFLLSSGNELFGMRNPFDYACKACLTCGLTYEDAEKIFEEFSARRKDFETSEQTSTKNFTQLIKSETTLIKDNDILSAEETRARLTALMLKYANDFCENRKDVGYSKQNMRRLQIFLRYLQEILDELEIEQRADGTPKFLIHLVRAALETENLNLPEYMELSKYGGLNLPERGELKRFYDGIPFNKNVLIPLRSLSKTLRSILRAIECPKNARAVDRDTVLLLTYFFIKGWRIAEPDVIERFNAKLEAEMGIVEPESPEESVLFALEDLAFAIDSTAETDEPPIKVYIAALNIMLLTFEFTDFYAPFVLDRFILLCLLSQENHPMNLIIRESYRLSKKLIDERASDEHEQN